MRERKRGKRQIQGLREKEIRRQRKTKKGDGKKEMDIGQLHCSVQVGLKLD